MAFMELMNRFHKNDSLIHEYLLSEENEWRMALGMTLVALERRRDEAQKKLKALEATRNQIKDYQEKRNRLRLELMETESRLDTIKDNRISLIKELLQSVHGWDSSSSFDGGTFRSLVKSVTVNGREDFIFHFRCGFSASWEEKKTVAQARTEQTATEQTTTEETATELTITAQMTTGGIPLNTAPVLIRMNSGGLQGRSMRRGR